MEKLLSREEFRTSVFKRDDGLCVLCGAKGVDAHHIIERRLFTAENELGGYFLSNGVTVCSECHLKCETTDVSVEQVRAAAGIRNAILPSHFEVGTVCDKWGNPVMPNGQRLRGEMFFEEQVQKALKGHLSSFTHWVKYPRTYHFPWSPGCSDDDKVLNSCEGMDGQRVIVTLKMDGENTTLYRDHIHARSLDSKHHPSRDWVKGFWQARRWDIPEYWRICGENLFARHSIAYEDLPSYFMGFSIWNERNVALSWDETQEWFDLMGIRSVPVLYDGVFDEKKIRDMFENLDTEKEEGIVVRVADRISYHDFRNKVAKAVRKNHVQTDSHWMHAEIVRNGIV